MFGDKLQLSSYSGEIIIDSPKELYFSGEHITGTYTLTARSSLTLTHIIISLICDEDAYVFVNNTHGGHYDHHRQRFVSMNQAVFPEHSITEINSTNQMQYTLKEGTHTYRFGFEIPLGPQSVPNKPYKSATSWYIMGHVSRGSTFARAIKTIHTINVCPYIRTPLNLNNLTEKSEKAVMKAFVPGFSERAKTVSGRFKGMFSSSSMMRKVETSCYLKVPVDGIPQAPAALPIEVDIQSDDEVLLFIMRFELDLKYKLEVTVQKEQETDIDLIKITKMDINLPVREGIEEIHKRLSRTSIDKVIPATFKTDNFNLTYKLVGYFYLSSQVNRRNSVKKVRVSIPAIVRYKGDCSGNTPPYDPEGHEYALIEKNAAQ